MFLIRACRIRASAVKNTSIEREKDEPSEMEKENK
jgi:hypothetical protein